MRFLTLQLTACAIFFGGLAPGLAAALDLPVSYLADQRLFQRYTLAGDVLEFRLYTDPVCDSGSLVYSEQLPADDPSQVVLEQSTPHKASRAPTRPSTGVRISAVLSLPDLEGQQLYLDVADMTGQPGLLGVGSDCQPLSAVVDTPIGVIVMWSGALATIPTGWAICDGTNGTPDLSNQFILGAMDAENPGATGGSASHSHSVDHTHPVDAPVTISSSDGTHGHSANLLHTHSADPSSAATNTAGAHTHSVSGNTGTAGGTIDWAGIGQNDGYARSHSHSVALATGSSGSHNHSVDVANTISTSAGSSGTDSAGTSHSHSVDIPSFDSAGSSGGSDTQSNEPVYFKLAFIMKAS